MNLTEAKKILEHPVFGDPECAMNGYGRHN